MIEVSNYIKENIYSDLRKITARVILKFKSSSDFSVDKNLVANEYIANNYKFYDQLVNELGNENVNYALYESEGIALDGSEILLSKNFIDENVELGYVSEKLSDSSGNINETIGAFIDSETESITINFSNVKQQYAVDFNIIIKNNSSILKKYEVRNNNEIEHYQELEKGNKTYIEVEIFKWSEANSHTKIVEFSSGKTIKFEGSDIKKIHIIKESSILSKELPSSQAIVELDNIDTTYNILNPVRFMGRIRKE